MIPVIVLIAVQGSVWTVGHFFWVDLALGPAIALFIAAVAAGRPAPAVRFLDTRPVRGLGSISYSLYLIHAPIVVVVYTQIVGPWLGHGVRAFLAMLAIAVPLSLVASEVVRCRVRASVHAAQVVAGAADRDVSAPGPRCASVFAPRAAPVRSPSPSMSPSPNKRRRQRDDATTGTTNHSTDTRIPGEPWLQRLSI